MELSTAKLMIFGFVWMMTFVKEVTVHYMINKIFELGASLSLLLIFFLCVSPK